MGCLWRVVNVLVGFLTRFGSILPASEELVELAQPTTHISTTRLRTLDPSLRPSTKHELSHVLQFYTRR